jgi:hypothetical protein
MGASKNCVRIIQHCGSRRSVAAAVQQVRVDCLSNLRRMPQCVNAMCVCCDPCMGVHVVRCISAVRHGSRMGQPVHQVVRLCKHYYLYIEGMSVHNTILALSRPCSHGAMFGKRHVVCLHLLFSFRALSVTHSRGMMPLSLTQPGCGLLLSTPGGHQHMVRICYCARSRV